MVSTPARSTRPPGRTDRDGYARLAHQAMRTGAHLAVIAGPDPGWVVGLAGRGVSIGRDPRSDLPLADPSLSRRHLRVRQRGGRIQVRDLGSVNGTRWRPARGRAVRRQAGSVPTRWRRRTRKVGRRWRQVRPGDLIHLGDSTLQIRRHPSLPAVAPRQPMASDGALPRLLLPVLMTAGMVPVLATSQAGPWRIGMLVLMPLGLLAAVVWPLINERRRRGRGPARADGPDEPGTDPTAEYGPDPAALLLSAQAPVPAEPFEPGSVRWDIGRAGQQSPSSPWAPRRRPGSTTVPAPEPGAGVALVGDPAAVDGLARYLVCQHLCGRPAAAVTAPDSWTWIPPAPDVPESDGAEPVRGRELHVVDARAAGDQPHAAAPDGLHLVLARHLGQVPAWCTRIVEVRANHDRQVCSRWARTLVSVRPTAGAARDLPQTVDAVDLLAPTDPAAILATWRTGDGGLAADIGLGVDGPVHLDLVRDGPHAVVAGTTGSGKSELLLAWVMALARRYPPGDVAFLLVDYKGGATFAPVSALPHVLGLLTDLDATATSRALASLRAELQRRERLLAGAGAGSLSDYRAAAAAEPLPRLMVIVDEFRAMSDDHPEHLDDLVRLAAQGRSLGIHLVLATQRPAGAISADMRANLTVRVCLRVLEDADSLDTIGSAAAAHLPAVPGRAILRTQRSTTFQAAWCGPADSVRTLAGDIATAANALFVEEPWRAHLPAPWAPPLPEEIGLADLRAAADEHEGDPHPGGPSLRWLRTDLPAEQRLGVHDLHLPARVLISGPPGSGRSTAAGTLAAAALGQGVPVHMLTGAELVPTGAPALGTWCAENDPRRAHRLLTLVTTDHGPAMVIVDDVESWAEVLEEPAGPGGGVDLITALLRQSRRRDLSLVLTATTPAHRWSALVDQHLVLAPRDPAEAVLAGVPKDLAGTGWPPGRGVLLGAGPPVVGHVATASGHGAATWPEPPVPPVRLLPLPAQVTLRSAPPQQGAHGLWLGVGGDDARWVGADLAPGGTWLVAGTPGTGRTTALRMLGAQIRAQGRDEVHIVDDADRVGAAELARLEAALQQPGACVIAAAHPDRLLNAYHDLGARLRGADVIVALSPVSPHLTGTEIRADLDTATPGRGVLVDGARVVPVQFARPGEG